MPTFLTRSTKPNSVSPAGSSGLIFCSFCHKYTLLPDVTHQSRVMSNVAPCLSLFLFLLTFSGLFYIKSRGIGMHIVKG